MKRNDLLILAGVGLLVYYFYKKNKKVVHIDPPMETKGEPKTIVLDLNRTRSGNNANRLFSQNMVKDYNASKFATTSPPSVVVKQMYNDL